MTGLTTRQRDLLRLLLAADAPLITGDIARRLELTPRQVNYSLKGMQPWLSSHDVKLNLTPGVGVSLDTNEDTQHELSQLLRVTDSFQLVLSPGQRQQLITLHLLTADEPLILYQLQQMVQVSRTTILKDLEPVEKVAAQFGIMLERRPNYGFEFSTDEYTRRQMLIALLWGGLPFEQPLWQMTHTNGLIFALNVDSAQLPVLTRVQTLTQQFDTQSAIVRVARAEVMLGGRFGDSTVLHLALAFAVQAQRIGEGKSLHQTPRHLDDLIGHPIWQAATRTIGNLSYEVEAHLLPNEIALVAAHLLGGSRDDRHQSDFENEQNFDRLITRLMNTISSAYEMPNLADDPTLRDGLMAHVIPACFRQQFHLWSPSQPVGMLSEKYAFEHALAGTLAAIIAEERETTLPEHEVNNLALLIRAAFIRERPNRLQRVIVVCHGGMATAQLLTARLKARFPRLGQLEVKSVRELSGEEMNSAELVITTIPLEQTTTSHIIQVHPLLLQEDIETITKWLA